MASLNIRIVFKFSRLIMTPSVSNRLAERDCRSDSRCSVAGRYKGILSLRGGIRMTRADPSEGRLVVTSLSL